MKFFLSLLAALFYSVLSYAQSTPGEIIQKMDKLETLGTVLYIAAHPDDENTRLLTWLSREKGVRTAYLSLTRGDGGQNLVGKEQGDLLGVLRTQELLQARRLDGAEQYFTRARDFGYSKNPEETFRIWNKDSVLSDVVWVIRMLKPDIIITRFPATGEGGHGHHTASALLALEAFDAAADKNRFPEQLKHLETWQAKSLYWNTFNFGGNNTTSEDQLKVNVGGYSSLLGKSYGEIASASRSMHKSQGFGSELSRGNQIEYLKHLKGEKADEDLFENVSLNWKRVNAGHIDSLLKFAKSRFNLRNPDETFVSSLLQISAAIRNLPEKNSLARHYKKLKEKEINDLIISATGIFADASASAPNAAPGDSIRIKTRFIYRAIDDIQIHSIEWAGIKKEPADKCDKNSLCEFSHEVYIPKNAAPTNPYWLADGGNTGSLTSPGPGLRGRAENPPYLTGKIELTILGERLTMELPLQYRSSDPVRGEIYQPFEIVPPVSIHLPAEAFVFAGSMPRTIDVRLRAEADNVKGRFEAGADNGWVASIHPAYESFSLKKKGEEVSIPVNVVPKKGQGSTLLTHAIVNDTKYSSSLYRVEYDHIPSQVVLTPSEANLVSVDIKTSGKFVAYIPGAGDEIPEALKQAGYTVSILQPSALSSVDLSKFDAVVTGIRAFNTNPALLAQSTQLQEYVKNGGNLIVQYNTNNRFAPLETTFAPYPFVISRKRVTDENAEVIFNNPDHPVLNAPNKITQKDFEGWVQERGIYFAEETDPNYQNILSMKDPGEDAHTGSLIIAPYGKGNFVYTGLAFFRQLKAGVPGAYRLFVNMVSLPENQSK